MKKIFTLARNPFAFGNRTYPIATEIQDPEWTPLHKGFYAAAIIDTRGRSHVVEKESGALIGNTIEEVNADIDACDDISIMQQQVEKAKEQCKEAQVLPQDEFWNRMR